MKKIIGSKRYDTETATLIADASSGGSRTDFSFWEEELYQKKTGEFFLYGSGGPMSRYSKACGDNNWSGDEAIIPLSLDAAKRWAEKYMDADDYEKVFGMVEEEGKTVCSFSLQGSTISQIALLAAEWKCSKSEVIDRLVRDTAKKKSTPEGVPGH